MTVPRAGQPAPDAEITADGGATVRLSALWAEKPLVLAFLPPVASPFCADNATQLRDDNLLHAAGASIVAVVAGTPADAAGVRAGWRTDFPIHSDASKQAQAAYGLVAADETRPGTFVIGTDGVLRYAHVGAAANDYPPIGQILPHVSALTGIVVEPPSLPEPSAATSFSAAPGMTGGRAAAGYTQAPPPLCIKCGSMQFSQAPISTAGGWLSRIFNFQHRRFTAVTCERCGYTELYKTGSSALANIADIFAGG